MAEKVLKEFTYDGYGVVVEVAKRDDQGNNIAKTYVRQEVTDKLRSDLDAEIKRATKAEATLQENIDTLTSSAVLDDEVEIDDNNLIKEITIKGDKKKIVAERAINDEDGNNIVDTYSTIAESDETNAKLAQEIERAKAAESKITEDLNAEINRATQAEATLKNDIDAETARATSAETLLTNNLNAEIERAKTAEGVLQTNIDNEVRNRESAIDTVTTNLNNEIKRSTDVDTQLTQDVSNLGNNLQKETDRASQAEENLHTEFTTQIGLEREARINADGTLSDRIERLEGKTTRLYYGEGTLSSPTALDIQTFITNQEVDPPYAPPYSGIAVVVYLTDEKTYHIWHYYTNLAAWKDDGIDTVTTFTNTTKGIIQGSTSEGYISADNGLGKVNGFSELKEQVGNNYDELNTKIEEETTRATEAEQLLTTNLNSEIARAKAAEEKLTADLNAEIQNRTNVDSTLQTNIDAEVSRAKAAEEKLTTDLEAEVSRATNKETDIDANLNKEIQDRTNADNALETNIENGTIIANKATNDSDGNPINTTYVKVEGFKTNYLDANNVAYKDDLEIPTIELPEGSTGTLTEEQFTIIQNNNIIKITANILVATASAVFTKATLSGYYYFTGLTVDTGEILGLGIRVDINTKNYIIKVFSVPENIVIQNDKIELTSTGGAAIIGDGIELSALKTAMDLGNVVNTGDSATPVSGGTTKFTTGGAYTLQQTLQGNIDAKQDKLTAGTGISIADNTISCTVTNPITATDVVIDLQ